MPKKPTSRLPEAETLKIAWLKQWRAYLGFTQKRAALALGIHHDTYRAMEAGRQSIVLRTLLACKQIMQDHAK